MTADAKPQARVLFDAILHPHRSLSRQGFILLMAAVTGVSLTVGGFFYFHGAWPIFGFYGLDVALIYFAMRANYRSGRIYEKVRLTDGELTVEKGNHLGQIQSWSFQPYWLRVSMDDPPQHESQIRLSSHGQSLIVGAFLTPEERLDFARALRAALESLRMPAMARA